MTCLVYKSEKKRWIFRTHKIFIKISENKRLETKTAARDNITEFTERALIGKDDILTNNEKDPIILFQISLL